MGNSTGEDTDYSSLQNLPEFYVRENAIRREMLDELRVILDDPKTKERHVQKCLEKHPEILAQCMGGGHGRWLIPQKRLGAEFVPDFLVGDRHSGGYSWVAVELKQPHVRPFLKSGKPSSTLVDAQTQIMKWRSWLEANHDYASKPTDQHGLGLFDIHSHVFGLILIGTRKLLTENHKVVRRQIEKSCHLQIHTYDWLFEWAGARCGHWESMRNWQSRVFELTTEQ